MSVFATSPVPAIRSLGSSTGLAAGSHLTEARCYRGLLEVIERDAMAVAELYHVGRSVELAEVQSNARAGN